MRVVSTIAAVALMMASPSVLFAAETGRQNPYSRLFAPPLNGLPALQLPTAPVRNPATRTTQVPKVVCGMTVMEGDSTIDPTIAHHPSKDGSKPAITIVEPKICRR